LSEHPHPLLCCFYSYGPLRDLPSFPTRRSSDLVEEADTRHHKPRVRRQGKVARPRAPPFGRDPIRREADPCLARVNGQQPHFLRSEEHTSELQSLTNLVCRLLLEKINTHSKTLR